jgi:hypothetical protein
MKCYVMHYKYFGESFNNFVCSHKSQAFIVTLLFKLENTKWFVDVQRWITANEIDVKFFSLLWSVCNER